MKRTFLRCLLSWYMHSAKAFWALYLVHGKCIWFYFTFSTIIWLWFIIIWLYIVGYFYYSLQSILFSCFKFCKLFLKCSNRTNHHNKCKYSLVLSKCLINIFFHFDAAFVPRPKLKYKHLKRKFKAIQNICTNKLLNKSRTSI